MNYGIKAHLISGRNLRRVMKGPDGEHGGEGTQAGGGDNTGGNAGGNSGDSGGGDNGGQAPDYSQFWRDPSERDSTTPSGDGSAATGNQSGGSQEQQKPNPAATLADNIKGLDFGSGVMTESAVKKLGEGDASEFNANLNQMGRDAVASAIQLIVPIMGQLRDQMRAEFGEKIQDTNTNRDNESALLKAIPSAKDPKVRPVVDTIYKQALKLNPGNVEAAINMTKDMLKLTATGLSDDIGLPPRGSGDQNGIESSTKIDWLDELAAR